MLVVIASKTNLTENHHESKACDPMPQHIEQLDMEIKKTFRLRYLQYQPKNFNRVRAKKYPLVIFLHGAGERGSDIEKVKIHGIPMLMEAGGLPGQDGEFVAVSPQCPEDKTWSIMDDELDIFLQAFINHPRIDTRRIYVTGLSMGGYGTWRLALRHPHVFAAIAPLCGGVEADDRLRSIKHLPVWVFHGAKDTMVPLDESANAVAILNEYEAPVKFTLYPALEHNVWTAAYNNPLFYQWLFKQENNNFVAF